MSEKSVWLTIWVSPRDTIRRIVKRNPNQSLWILAAIYGFSALLNSFQSLSLGSSLAVLPILLLAVILAPFWGYLLFAVWSWVVTWTGRWLKGKGSFQEVRAAYAWSCVPLAISAVLWVMIMFLLGPSLFMSPPPEQVLPQGQALFLLSLLLGKVILSVWSLVIYLNCLAEVQRFSAWRAIGNVIIGAILVGIVIGIFWAIILYVLGIPTGQTPNAGAAFQLLQEGKIFLAPGVAL